MKGCDRGSNIIDDQDVASNLLGRFLFIPDSGVETADDVIEKSDVQFFVKVEELLRLKLGRVGSWRHGPRRHRREENGRVIRDQIMGSSENVQLRLEWWDCVRFINISPETLFSTIIRLNPHQRQLNSMR